MEVLDKKNVGLVVEKLEKSYPNIGYYLNFKTPIDLLVAAILSPQTRDVTVNKVTPELFKKYKTAKDYATANPDELFQYIKSIAFAKTKMNNIIESCKLIDKQYKGKVPDKKDELMKLPGIGEKTAVTILINAYGIVEGIPVDTWVIKLSNRIGLADSTNPNKIEKELEQEIDKKYWHNFAYILKEHGKEICGKVPFCSKCVLNEICLKNNVEKSK